LKKRKMAEEKEKTHYSKTELDEFREVINKKLQDAKDEFNRLQDSLREANEIGSDSYNMTEFGADTIDKEQIEMFMAREARFVNNLERALIRISNGTYGRCKVTGKLIQRERLLAVPHTELSLDGKNQMKNGPKILED